MHEPATTAPRFTAWSLTSIERNGRAYFRSASANSAVSQADAEQLARKLARERAEAAARGEPPQSSKGEYPYPERVQVEPVLERILLPSPAGESAGVELGRISRNNYDASVLNAYGVMFVDVDTSDDTSNAPSERIVDQDTALSALVDLCAQRVDLGFRVYATRAGLRYLCTTRTFDPVSTESQEILRQLKSDPRYATLCRVQKCYRARLTPKPWRCLNTTKPRGFFSRLIWPSGLPENQANFATCRFLETVGSGSTIPATEIIVRLHDNATGAQSKRALA